MVWISVMLCLRAVFACCFCMLGLHAGFKCCVCMLCLHAVFACCVCMLLTALVGQSTRQPVCLCKRGLPSASYQKLHLLFQKWKRGAGCVMLCGSRKAQADVWLLPGGLPLQVESYQKNIRRKQERMPDVVHRFLL